MEDTTEDPKLDPDHWKSEQCDNVKCISCYRADSDITEMVGRREERIKELVEEVRKQREEILVLRKKLVEWRAEYPTLAEAKVQWVGDEDIRVDPISLEGEEGEKDEEEEGPNP